MIRLIASNSNLIDLSNEIFGARTITGVIGPLLHHRDKRFTKQNKPHQADAQYYQRVLHN